MTKIIHICKVNLIMAEVDFDFNGKLDILEFVTFMSRVLFVNFDNMAELETAFKVFDTNGDGILSKEELRFAFWTFGVVEDDDDVEELMEMFDADNDGFLSYNEFVTMFSQFLLLY